MKKQILILVFLVLATFAGVNKSYGQLLPDLTVAPTYCPSAKPVVAICGAADALHPIAGTLYPYTVTVSNAGAAALIHWYVTTDPAFMTAGAIKTAAIEAKATSSYIQAAGSTYNDPANKSNTIDITWKYFPPSVDVYLVTYVTNTAGCTDNIQVYKIVPVQIFTLDIATLTAAGVSNAVNSDCVAPIESASWDGTNVLMDYGVNYVYFTVNAANFSHSWMPTFQVSATNMGTDGTLAVDWAYPSKSYTGSTPVWNITTAAAGIFTSGTAVLPVTAAATGVGAAGECIVVRVTVDHNKNETLSDIVLSIAVDGIMYDFATTLYATATLGDVHDDTGVTVIASCTGVDGYTNDKVTYTLTSRPTVLDATTPPVGDDFLPKN